MLINNNVCRILVFCITNSWDKLSEDDKIAAKMVMNVFNEMMLGDE